MKINVLKNFANLTGKHDVRISFLQSCRPEVPKQVLYVNFSKFLRPPF